MNGIALQYMSHGVAVANMTCNAAYFRYADPCMRFALLHSHMLCCPAAPATVQWQTCVEHAYAQVLLEACAYRLAYIQALIMITALQYTRLKHALQACRAALLVWCASDIPTIFDLDMCICMHA